MERSNHNGTLTLKDVNKEVKLVGWVHKKRNLGSLLFIDLRDRSGIVQVTVREGTKVPDVRNEYVIWVKGKVAKKDVPNKQLKLYYRLFDAFVTASNFETQGLTYFEAAASGTVIVAREDEAIQNIFFDKVNAYIYKDFLGWTERIEKALYGNNKDIIKAAKKTLRDNSQEKWAKEMVKIYQEINE